MPVPNPVAFTVFGIDIMWYGILICIGMLLATFITYKRAPLHSIESDKVLDYVLVCIPAGIVGARLYYVIFNWSYYAGDFHRIIDIRSGGLAIHGGLLFGLGAAVILCMIWKIRPLNILDLVIPSIALAQSIGRWGNYFNSEAHGGPTDLPWAVIIDGVPCHPTFLYESIWCMLLFIFLLWKDNHRKFEGQIILLYGMLYSAERFFVEALRTDSLMIGPFKQAQVLSITLIIICAAAYVLLAKRSKANLR
ncbi:MAG: prolipoprotein diacylglyceryl transferase [Firmicutes bacterium]|nr:prolipoprotein diacylglyceryl transferase [Bacillota bacterium]